MLSPRRRYHKQLQSLSKGVIRRCAGSPSAKRREAILGKLKVIPHVIVMIAARTATTHYRVGKGDMLDDC